jgi:type II restriction enzyme
MDLSVTPLIDFSDPCLRSFLPVLLQDHTTDKNIIWATDPPPELGVGFADEITLEQLDKVRLVPRVQKRLADQKKRTCKKAEVFTPTWVCKKMTDVAENDLKCEDWKEYINKTCLEVTCGEAPFLTSRYDTTTGQMIAVPDRIGLLDRKLNAITKEHFKDPKVWDYSLWLNYAMNAYMSTYGYEWQGDNLLLARCNLFLTLMENFRSLFGNEIENHRMSPVLIDAITDVISWNVWQMDGLKKTVPGTDIPCKIKDWKAYKEILFKDVGEDG